MINRLGFNSEGADAVLRRLAARAERGGIVGVNVGANKDSADRIADYVRLIETFAPVASYFTVNISSPNTPGLRDLQQGKSVRRSAGARGRGARPHEPRGRRRRRCCSRSRPTSRSASSTTSSAVARRHKVDGMIVGNTTIARPHGLRDQATAQEAGGLSGRPLFALSTRMLAETYVRVEGAFPLIGVGGIDSGADGARQDQGRGVPRAALQRAGVPRPAAGRAISSLATLAAAIRGSTTGRRRCRRDDGETGRCSTPPPMTRGATGRSELIARGVHRAA